MTDAEKKRRLQMQLSLCPDMHMGFCLVSTNVPTYYRKYIVTLGMAVNWSELSTLRAMPSYYLAIS